MAADIPPFSGSQLFNCFLLLRTRLKSLQGEQEGRARRGKEKKGREETVSEAQLCTLRTQGPRGLLGEPRPGDSGEHSPSMVF